jgi:hypothetical protein
MIVMMMTSMMLLLLLMTMMMTMISPQVRLDKKEQREESSIYAHLFNDALLYSSVMIGGMYKIRKIIPLSQVRSLQI